MPIEYLICSPPFLIQSSVQSLQHISQMPSEMRQRAETVMSITDFPLGLSQLLKHLLLYHGHYQKLFTENVPIDEDHPLAL